MKRKRRGRTQIARSPFIVAVTILLVLVLTSQMSLGSISVALTQRGFEGALSQGGDPEEIAPEFLEFLGLYLLATDDVAKALEYIERGRRYNIEEYLEIGFRLLAISERLLDRCIRQHEIMMERWEGGGIFSEHDSHSIPYLREQEWFSRIYTNLRTGIFEVMETRELARELEDQWNRKRRAIEEGSHSLQESIHQDLVEMKDTVYQMRTERETRVGWTPWHSIAVGACIGVVVTVSIVTSCAGTVPAIKLGVAVGQLIVGSTVIPTSQR